MSTQTEHLKLTDTSRLVRDPFSKGLIATDQAGLGAYKAQRRQSEKIQVLENDINSLTAELKSIKDLCLEAFGKKI